MKNEPRGIDSLKAVFFERIDCTIVKIDAVRTLMIEETDDSFWHDMKEERRQSGKIKQIK